GLSLMTTLVTIFWLPSVGVPALLIYLAFTLGLARYLCLVGIERLPGLHSRVEQAGRKLLGTRRNPFILPFSQNPVVARECRRDAARTPMGLVGWLLLRHNVVWVCLAASYYLLTPGNVATANNGFWVVLVGMSIIQFMRAARRNLGAVVTELEQKTLDSLQTTNLRHTEYVDGWLAVGTVPCWLQNLVMTVPLTVLAIEGKVGLTHAVLGWLAFMLMPAFGAALGLYSSVASSRAETHQRLSNAVVVSGVLACALYFSLSLQLNTLILSDGVVSELFLCAFLLGASLIARQQAQVQTSQPALR
ncbi:MAG: hypothetical protein KC910_34735, partial [Candidatus Eremiobacteraeota bacterium]|nr:hypothetical protein [Candidatus Eremiobacteraeota bacterium]